MSITTQSSIEKLDATAMRPRNRSSAQASVACGLASTAVAANRARAASISLWVGFM
jgi:hypothetical protein